jgi:micrococcal nuclease
MSLPALLICLVVGISDGDTLTARCNDQTLKIRLAEIDAPEKAQPFGARSKQSLSALCFQKQAEIRSQATDRYGRTVARVTCDGIDANTEQVRSGMAWVYDKYVLDKSLSAVQGDAKAARRGLWSDAEAMPPWEWRSKGK